MTVAGQHEFIEKAYVRGLKEGKRRGAAYRATLLERISELVIRLKTARGEIKRMQTSPVTQEWFADHDSVLISKAEYDAMKGALLLAAIPLEALHADNKMGAKWMAPSVKAHVGEAVNAIRNVVVTLVAATSETKEQSSEAEANSSDTAHKAG